MKKWLLGLVVIALLAATGLVYKQVQHNQVAHERNLVALGDSVTAGDGLHATSAHDPVACQRSDLAYPYLVAKELKLQVRQFACSSAKVSTGFLKEQDIVGGKQPPQVEAAKPYLPNSDVVMTIGINDVGGLELLAKCAQQTNCLSSDEATNFQAALPDMVTNLSQALHIIQDEHPRRVVVNTYYHLLEKNDTCYEQFGLTPAKIATIYQLQDQLNAQIKATAEKVGAKVVAIDFRGHGLCADEPWIQDLISKSPLHPTEAGQQQIAKQDEAVLR